MDALLCFVPIPVSIPAQGGTRLPGCYWLLWERQRCIGISKTRICPRTEFGSERRGILRSEDLPTMTHKQTTVQTFLYLDMGPGIARLLGPRVQLQGAPSVPHRVILRHAPYLLDAEHTLYVQSLRHLTIGRPRLGSWHTESLVELG
jgi:hypothetical protein